MYVNSKKHVSTFYVTWFNKISKTFWWHIINRWVISSSSCQMQLLRSWVLWKCVETSSRFLFGHFSWCWSLKRIDLLWVRYKKHCRTGNKSKIKSGRLILKKIHKALRKDTNQDQLSMHVEISLISTFKEITRMDMLEEISQPNTNQEETNQISMPQEALSKKRLMYLNNSLAVSHSAKNP